MNPQIIRGLAKPGHKYRTLHLHGGRHSSTSRRGRKPRYDSLESHRELFLEVQKSLGVQSMEDWYSVSLKDLQDAGASSLMANVYGNSPAKALVAIFPEYDWRLYSFHHKPHRFWSDVANQREFLDALMVQYQMTSLDDWYTVSASNLRHSTLRSLLSEYNACLPIALQTVYPEHDWRFELFSNRMRNFWKTPSNRRRFLETLGARLGLDSLDGWYNVSQQQVASLGGRGVLAHHKQSLVFALLSLFPEHRWEISRFQTVPRGHWSDRENVRNYFEALAPVLNVRDLDDWYQVRFQDIEQSGGGGLLQNFGNSVAKALAFAYPTHNWLPFRFASSPRGLYKEFEVVKQFIFYVEEELFMTSRDDWYRVSLEIIDRLGGRQLIKKNGGITNVLPRVIPEREWDALRFLRTSSTKKSSQFWLRSRLKKILHRSIEMIEDYHSSILTFDGSNISMEFDIFLPEHNVAFEYQGKQHYEDTMMFGLSINYKRRDHEKRIACASAGITLIEVPYWWNGEAASLAATVRDVRPALVAPHVSIGTPIPTAHPALATTQLAAQEPTHTALDRTELASALAGVKSRRQGKNS